MPRFPDRMGQIQLGISGESAAWKFKGNFAHVRCPFELISQSKLRRGTWNPFTSTRRHQRIVRSGLGRKKPLQC